MDNRDQFCLWWCQLNAHQWPKDPAFPFVQGQAEEAWRWINGRVNRRDALAYWNLNFIKRERKATK